MHLSLVLEPNLGRRGASRRRPSKKLLGTVKNSKILEEGRQQERCGRWALAGSLGPALVKGEEEERGGALADGESQGVTEGALTGLQITLPSLNSGHRFWRFGEDTGNTSSLKKKRGSMPIWNPKFSKE